MQLQSLSQIFNDQRLFRIPDFQRGYSQGDQQLKDFWSDLEILGNGRVHYTGQLTIKAVDNEVFKQWLEDAWRIQAGVKAYHVIDGQQRLTTSIILINLILNKFKQSDFLIAKKKDYWVEKFIYGKYTDNVRSYIF